jgi:hypothetical protein
VPVEEDAQAFQLERAELERLIDELERSRPG